MAAHERERDRGPSVARGEVEEPADLAVSQSRPSTTRLSPWSSRRSSSRDIAKPRSASPAGASSGSPGRAPRVPARRVPPAPQLGRVALFLQSRDRLPDLPDRRPSSENGPFRPPPRRPGTATAARVAPRAEAPPRRRRVPRFSPLVSANRLSSRSRAGIASSWAHRVAGDEQDAGLDAIAEECAPVWAEEIVLVAAELEVRERVVRRAGGRAPAPLAGRRDREAREARRAVGRAARRTSEREHTGDADGLVHGAELIVEIKGPGCQRSAATVLARLRRCSRSPARRAKRPSRRAETRSDEEWDSLQRSPQRRGVVANAKRSSSEPEHDRRRDCRPIPRNRGP